MNEKKDDKLKHLKNVASGDRKHAIKTGTITKRHNLMDKAISSRGISKTDGNRSTTREGIYWKNR
ncbi:hypothetical protein AcV5_003371 [Taiwanofungus camphoratus]|nr:hypothetical protein AcV5_003371 [Antrodia cinnamomea]